MQITASTVLPGRTEVSITPDSDVAIRTADRGDCRGVSIHAYGIGYSGVNVHMEDCGLATNATVLSVGEGEYVALNTGDGSSLMLSAEQARAIANFVNAS